MGSSTSRPVRPEISLCSSNGSSEGPYKMKSSSVLLLDSQYFMQCVASGASVSTARSEANLPPMPRDAILNQRFDDVLASIGLPADKERILKGYSDEQKWDIICAHERLTPSEKPSHYLSPLNKHLDSVHCQKKRLSSMNSSITDILSHLEVSLRTNTMEWVEEFLAETNQGLETLVKYFKISVEMLMEEHSEDDAHREGQGISKSTREISTDARGPSSSLSMLSNHSRGDMALSGSKTHVSLSLPSIFNSSRREQRFRHFQRFKSGTSTTDVHICLLCLRAIMNNQIGFNLVVQHQEAINLMVLSLACKSVRTKALILNLLTDICMVKGSHEMVLAAFDNFKEVCREQRRFETILQYLMKNETDHMEYMVSCIKFLNVLVHTVEDLNFRVSLQHELSAQGLDVFLEKLSHTESEKLKAEIDAYRTNFVDVSAYMKTTELKRANERIRQLEKSLARQLENNNKLKEESKRLVAMRCHEAELAKRTAPITHLALSMSPFLINEERLPPLELMKVNLTNIRREKPKPPARRPINKSSDSQRMEVVSVKPEPPPKRPVGIIPISMPPSVGTSLIPCPAHNTTTPMPISNIVAQPEAREIRVSSPDHNIQMPLPAYTAPIQPPDGTIHITANACATHEPPHVWHMPMAPSPGTVPMPPTLSQTDSVSIPPPMTSDHTNVAPPKAPSEAAPDDDDYSIA